MGTWNYHQGALVDPEQVDQSIKVAFREPISRLILEQGSLATNEPEAQHGKPMLNKHGAGYHSLWKLMTQLSFGVHLLRQQSTKPDNELANFLNGHSHEIDLHLKRTAKDFKAVYGEVVERTKCLKLILDRVSNFQSRLANEDFRESVFEGRRKIETISSMTSRAITRSLKDIDTGIEAVTELRTCLNGEWDDIQEDALPAYIALKSKADIWRCNLEALRMKGNDVNVALEDLCNKVEEMNMRARIASRITVG